MSVDDKRSLILKHYKEPVNKLENFKDGYISGNADNASCVDNITVKVLVNDNKLEDITFDGEACAISIASTSIMIENLIGKTIDEANDYILAFENMLDDKKYDKEILKDAYVFDEMYKQSSRKTCALLPYIAIKKAINKN